MERCGRRGLGALTHAELQELALLYRQTASDLAAVREDPSSRSVADYLNQLLGRAHNLIYMGRRGQASGIVHFYRVSYPQIFRETFVYTATAFVIFFALAVTGYLVTLGDPEFPRYVLGSRMMDKIERREMWTDRILTVQPQASAGILTNNLTVGFTAFALGITGGVGTVWLLAFNGLLMGVIAAACHQAGMSISLWSFVATHGVLELPSIFIAGGAGLLIARGLLFPGLLARRESLRLASSQAARLLLGTVPLLIVAGFLEGYVSPSELPAAAKFAFAATLGTIFALYLSRAGLPDRQAGRPSPSPPRRIS